MTPRHGAGPSGRVPWRRRLHGLVGALRGRLGLVPADGLAEDPQAGDPSPRDAPGVGHGRPVMPGLGPHAHGFREDAARIDLAARPRQGRLGDCWVIAAMLAVHEQAPERIAAALQPCGDGTYRVVLPAGEVDVDRRMPVDAAGRWVYATQSGSGPGWPGLIEKALAAHLAGSYGFLARGLGRYGLRALTGTRPRMHLLLPGSARISELLGEGRAVLASTHPLSPLVRGPHGRLPADHVMAVVGADAASGHVHLRNPWRPDELLVLDRRSFRRGFLSLDVSGPLG